MRRRYLSDNKMIKESVIRFNKSDSYPANMSGDINKGYVATLLSQFRRCLCTKVSDGQVAICYLDDNNSLLYHDGTEADINNSKIDVMVNFPEFWYKYFKIDDNTFEYHIANGDTDGTYKHVPRSLVGAFEGYLIGNVLFSWYNVPPSHNLKYESFFNGARLKGAGYQIIDFNQHCTIDMMMYAKYGTRDLASVLGVGDADRTTYSGGTVSIGNNDTNNAKTGHVNGLGIEGVFGTITEFMEGISIREGIYTITNPDGTQRTVDSRIGQGYISNMNLENGPYFDMIPTGTGGDNRTYYVAYFMPNYNLQEDCYASRSAENATSLNNNSS